MRFFISSPFRCVSSSTVSSIINTIYILFRPFSFVYSTFFSCSSVEAFYLHTRKSSPSPTWRWVDIFLYFYTFSMLRTLKCIFSFSSPWLSNVQRKILYACGRQKYYKAEGILLVLVDKRSIAQPSILLWRKMYDITLYFFLRPLRFPSPFVFLSFSWRSTQTTRRRNKKSK